MRQLDLFGPPAVLFGKPLLPRAAVGATGVPARGTAAPFRAGQETQAAGAAAIEPHRRGLRGLILAYLRGRPNGATNEELVNALGLKLQTVCGRIGELRDARQVVDSGVRRRGASGVPAKAWRAV